MSQLPQALVESIRDEARRAVLHYAPSRAELAALRQLVMTRVCVLTATERQFLLVALPILARLLPGAWFHSREVLALSVALRDEDGAALRAACAPYRRDQAPDSAEDARRLGKAMTRCTGVPVAGFYLERIEAAHRRDSAGYRVASCAGLMP